MNQRLERASRAHSCKRHRPSSEGCFRLRLLAAFVGEGDFASIVCLYARTHGGVGRTTAVVHWLERLPLMREVVGSISSVTGHPSAFLIGREEPRPGARCCGYSFLGKVLSLTSPTDAESCTLCVAEMSLSHPQNTNNVGSLLSRSLEKFQDMGLF